MPKFRIENRAAKHRRKVDGVWRSFGFGDQLDLTTEQFNSGKYDHLRLKPLYATQVSDDDSVVHVPAATPVEPISGTGTGQGGDGSSTDPITPNPDDADKDPAGGGEDDADISDAKVKALLQEVKDSKVDDGTFAVAREKVVALDLFEADTLPETKKGVIEALESLIGG